MDQEFYRPTRNRLCVKRLDYVQSTIILTDSDPYSREAIVVSVGPEVTEVKPGDRVLIPGMASNHPDFEKGHLAWITEDDVAGVLA